MSFDLPALIEQAKQASPAVVVAGLKRLWDTIQPAFGKQAMIGASANEVRSLGAANLDMLSKQLDVLESIQQRFPGAEVEIKEGPIRVSLPPNATQVLARVINQGAHEQANFDSVVGKAAERILHAHEGEYQEGRVNEDWFTRFFDGSKQISDDQMQTVWGRILAGEVLAPGSYSLRALDVVRNLTSFEANQFTKLAALGFISKENTFVFNPDRYKTLAQQYGISFDTVLRLRESGLLVASDTAGMLMPSTENPVLAGIMGPLFLTLTYLDDPQSRSQRAETIPTISLTHAGTELARLSKANPPVEFIESFLNFFPSYNVRVEYFRFIRIDGDRVIYDDEGRVWEPGISHIEASYLAKPQ